MTSHVAANDQITTDLTTMFAVQPFHGPERRAFVRLPYAAEAHGSISDAREGIVRVHNVSRIGVRLDSPCALPVGTTVTLNFGEVYLFDEPVRLDGRVIWSRTADLWHPTGIALDHTGHATMAAASELFYAAVAAFAGRYGAVSARIAAE